MCLQAETILLWECIALSLVGRIGIVFSEIKEVCIHMQFGILVVKGKASPLLILGIYVFVRVAEIII